jgi:hypothetical protein
VQGIADALSEELGEPISYDAIFNAHRRYRVRLGLRDALSEYFSEEGVPVKDRPPRLKPADIRYSLSEERWEAIGKARKFVITSAMNNREPTPLWGTIKQYAKHTGAEIIIIPNRYKNPKTTQDAQEINDDAWWHSELEPYMTDDFVELHEHLWLMSHVRVQATAINPLSGLEGLSKGASAIFGHPQLAMKTVPSGQVYPKALWTTGSVTEASYSDTKAGIKGDFHHTNGTLVVELDGDYFHVRNLTGDSNWGFYDFDKGSLRYYHPKGSRRGKNALGLVTGDEHAMFADESVKKATYTDPGSIVKVARPEKIVRHDVLDFYASSHHRKKDPVHHYALHKYGIQKVEDELQLTIDYIDETTPDWAESIIVASNHHEHLLRWMKEICPLVSEPWNVDVWIELWADLKETIAFGESGVSYGDPFARWAEKRLKKKARFLRRDDEELIGEIAVNNHGDAGTNGSRGSINQFSKVGVRTIIGHGHSPGIRHGCFQTGTSDYLKRDYRRGPSSNMHAHVLIHANGKRQMIFIINGRYRGLPEA